MAEAPVSPTPWKNGVIPVFKNQDRFKDRYRKDNSLQNTMGSRGTTSLLQSWDGVSAGPYIPPDCSGDVGLNHYMEMVNIQFQIWDKTGTSLLGPLNLGTLWSGFPGPWSSSLNDGDPVILYDEAADRWVATQFSLPNYGSSPNYILVAVSQTSDPTGSWYRYGFEFPDFPDYPKYGVWPDGYYVSANHFSGSAVGTTNAAFEREAMLNGDPAQMVLFNTSLSISWSLLPSDWNGTNTPPAGSPNYFGQIHDNAHYGGNDGFDIFSFHVDWTTPTNSTFTGPTFISVNAFSQVNGISQQGTSQLLDDLSDRVMNRLDYRNFGSYQSMVTCHTVDAGAGRAGVRWYEFRNSGSGWSLFQQGTYAPADGLNRWMGSIAINDDGAIALGYSVSGSSLYPSIRYTGRNNGDTPGVMTLPEETIQTGSGSQTSYSRWGDYTQMVVDPNGNDFWYINEYLPYSGNFNWNTRIASFTFGLPCPVDPAYNPNPANSAEDVPVSLGQLTWTNGSGATQCEVWFGEPGSVNKVYDGSLVSYWNIPSTLGYNTNYEWYIVDKNDTCDAAGPLWSFTTELSPNIVFAESFEDMSCWTAIGPLGTSNWDISSTNNAGGISPEMDLNWAPQFDGLSKLVSCVIPVEGNHNYSVTFNHMIDWYANTAPTLGLGISYNNGSTYSPIWSVQPTGNIGPEQVSASFTTSSGATVLYLVLFCDGNSYNIDDWYIDDITMYDDEFSTVEDPTGVAAEPVSSSQIDLTFTPNIDNDNVVIVWNLTGTFDVPSGTPPVAGQPFAGGTLLYYGTNSPVNHNGLDPVTEYYYKLFSYNGADYSSGVLVNAQTLPLPTVEDPTGVAAEPVSSSQIDLIFTPNINNDNVVIVWNLTGTFDVPSGTPPADGQPFAGGTLLYNGTNSPVNHNGLDPVTEYYYKLFSYDGANYSSGVTVNAQTPLPLDFSVQITVSDNCANNAHPLVFGTAPGATDCFDPGLDLSAPPPPPAGVIDGRFSSCSEDYFTDIRETNTASERVWDMSFRPNTGCDPLTLTWDPAELPPDGYFHLVDPFLGTLVNVNMRLNNSYPDDQGIGQLQIVYNYQIQAGFNISQGWNMLSLPVDVTNNYYLALFPNATTGSLYGYAGSYVSLDTIKNGGGYWLKFSGSETAEVNGSDRTECVVDLTTGWNMIGGPDCTVSLSDVIDPGDIIIPGTLYGYSGSYVSESTIAPTKGYWIKTNSAGTVTISCGGTTANPAREMTIPEEKLSEFVKININDAGDQKQTLYFNGKLDKDISIESFSLPPVPPQGIFDVRLSGGYKLTESDEITIEIRSAEYPLSIKINCPGDKILTGYILQEISDGRITGSHPVVNGEKIVLNNPALTMLKIKKEEEIPVSYDLAQNFPNPFNPSTTIVFSLPEDVSNAKLTIYNMLGQKIDELVNRSLPAGRFSYTWNAKGRATGLYVYELRTEKFTSIRKMLLIK